MELAPQLFRTSKRASVADAKLAYFEGDFERCLAICAEIRVRTLTTASEVALIEARAYLRTGRPREAQSTIVNTLDTHATLDASLTAQMLLATARIRQNDADAGLAMLADATARSAGAHFAIRSEIAFCTAFGHWMKREIAVAETYLEQVDPRSDIIHARALELQAWCHLTRHDYSRAADYFQSTLLRLDDCRASDRAITATAISTLAICAAELFDRDLATFVEARAQAVDWSSGLTEQRYLLLHHQALFAEFAGETIKAYQFATQARETAPSVPFEVLGWGLSAAIARNAGESYSAIFFAQRAQALLETIDASELHGEERIAILIVAENCAYFDLARAEELLAVYRGMAPLEKFVALSGDPRLTAAEAFIEGVIAQARGDLDAAQTYYRDAFTIFKKLGYVRRALTSAHAYIQLAEDSELRSYLHDHLTHASNYITASLAQPSYEAAAILERHPVVASLSRAQREVVALICMGKSNKEVARLRNVGEQTIKNMLTKQIFRAFGVSSRAALVSACLRDGRLEK
jgi:DNA-binding CsgD family transcriptional regulator